MQKLLRVADMVEQHPKHIILAAALPDAQHRVGAAVSVSAAHSLAEAEVAAVAVPAFWSIAMVKFAVSSLPSTNTLPDFQSIHWIEPVRSSVME